MDDSEFDARRIIEDLQRKYLHDFTRAYKVVNTADALPTDKASSDVECNDHEEGDAPRTAEAVLKRALSDEGPSAEPQDSTHTVSDEVLPHPDCIHSVSTPVSSLPEGSIRACYRLKDLEVVKDIREPENRSAVAYEIQDTSVQLSNYEKIQSCDTIQGEHSPLDTAVQESITVGEKMFHTRGPFLTGKDAAINSSNTPASEHRFLFRRSIKHQGLHGAGRTASSVKARWDIAAGSVALQSDKRVRCSVCLTFMKDKTLDSVPYLPFCEHLVCTNCAFTVLAFASIHGWQWPTQCCTEKVEFPLQDVEEVHEEKDIMFASSVPEGAESDLFEVKVSCSVPRVRGPHAAPIAAWTPAPPPATKALGLYDVDIITRPDKTVPLTDEENRYMSIRVKLPGMLATMHCLGKFQLFDDWQRIKRWNAKGSGSVSASVNGVFGS